MGQGSDDLDVEVRERVRRLHGGGLVVRVGRANRGELIKNWARERRMRTIKKCGLGSQQVVGSAGGGAQEVAPVAGTDGGAAVAERKQRGRERVRKQGIVGVFWWWFSGGLIETPVE